MKTKLLKRLRWEARDKYPGMPLREFILSLGLGYEDAIEYIYKKRANYILRRVRKLKQKRK
ncbi:MAG: hypothetical protein ACLVBA_16940 [Alistipes finegoldii]|uniref:hypothetical protein n=1 Tax=Alistipes finegoldii TaxID=214856 RepID=UPI00399C736C